MALSSYESFDLEWQEMNYGIAIPMQAAAGCLQLLVLVCGLRPLLSSNDFEPACLQKQS